MRVLVAGSRFWTDEQTLTEALALVYEPDGVLVTGACPEGAEELAALQRRSWGGQVERWEFDWDQAAGTIVPGRHWRMLEAGADVCLTFGGLTGPQSLEAMSRAAGVPTYGWT
ncbi:SLOG family protein [Actinomycetospora lutea]|uniref:SLOG family protein n=1 Tax=Actinomycetospora lutea TaxID=663604 RepID=UPI0023666975|nr:SLOG family protein [Actinomycetospora lutea]MDD7936985.1 SLOG family protein [Actinomycetospora lutea]